MSLNRPPGRTWRRPPGRPRNNWLDSYETIPRVRLETCGDVLSTVDMVVQRRDGPRRLRDDDDDDDLAILYKKLSYRRGTARCVVQLKSCQLPRNSAETTCTTSPEPARFVQPF